MDQARMDYDRKMADEQEAQERSTEVDDKLRDLTVAKRNVMWLLEHQNGLVDMMGLVYWANVVEWLRKEITEAL